ncbi:hypothetical protein BBF96_12240 [Anoxybacter fermentans]|uniref:Uncharacterized protein n=1 Tax=Anoxybacter fermentans TaxID=1323375 RepID=A0A3Q9HS54_9FIRM|nr:hypothetical protein [Anoxybacter fermentans]AZR74098.1 hypothetical protein BBF96_12240 [Anoxybacter fermentans]
MNVKVSIILIVMVFIFVPSIYAMQLYSEPFWANSVHGFAIGTYGDIKLLLTVNISKSSDDLLPDSFNLKLYKITFGGIEPIEIDWIDMPKWKGEYSGCSSVFCDFDGDEKDEIFVIRTEDVENSEIYVYKIFLEEKRIEKIWSEEVPGDVCGKIKLDEHNLLIQVGNIMEDYLFILGYKDGQIIKKWEMKSSYGEYLESQFVVVDNSNIYVRVGENKWKKLQIINDEIVFLTPPEEVLKYLDTKSIGTLNLNGDNELETIKQIWDRRVRTYIIYGIDSGREKFRIKLPDDNGILRGVFVQSDSFPKIILSNGYSIFWENGQFVYKPWIEEFDNSGDFKIWNLVNADLDDDGRDEYIFLRRRKNQSNEPYNIKIWMVKY